MRVTRALALLTAATTTHQHFFYDHFLSHYRCRCSVRYTIRRLFCSRFSVRTRISENFFHIKSNFFSRNINKQRIRSKGFVENSLPPTQRRQGCVRNDYYSRSSSFLKCFLQSIVTHKSNASVTNTNNANESTLDLTDLAFLIPRICIFYLKAYAYRWPFKTSFVLKGDNVFILFQHLPPLIFFFTRSG